MSRGVTVDEPEFAESRKTMEGQRRALKVTSMISRDSATSSPREKPYLSG